MSGLLQVDSISNSAGTGGPSYPNGVVGVATNASAAIGVVGEYISAYASTTTGSSGVYQNIATLTLTAGDWDVNAQMQFTPQSMTGVTSMGCYVSLYSGNTQTDVVQGDNLQETSPVATSGFYMGATVAGCRVAISPSGQVVIGKSAATFTVPYSSGITLYLKSQVSFSSGSSTGLKGGISARRMR